VVRNCPLDELPGGGGEKKGEGEEGCLFIVTSRSARVLYSLIRARRSPREAPFYSREILRFRANQNREPRELKCLGKI